MNMKKKICFILRTWLLITAMITVGASTAAAQTETDYFSITKDFGNGVETKYYTSLDAAITAAANGDEIELLKDYTVTSTVTINKSITLDLNDYDITGNFSNNRNLIEIPTETTVTVTIKSTERDPDKKGTITHNVTSSSYYAIKVNSGTLNVEGVSIQCPEGGASVFYS